MNIHRIIIYKLGRRCYDLSLATLENIKLAIFSMLGYVDGAEYKG